MDVESCDEKRETETTHPATHPVERAKTNVVAANQKAVVASVDDDKRKLAVQVVDAVCAVLEVQRYDHFAVAARLVKPRLKKTHIQQNNALV